MQMLSGPAELLFLLSLMAAVVCSGRMVMGVVCRVSSCLSVCFVCSVFYCVGELFVEGCCYV